ncbi:MAG TPA: cupredoxin domain-containing protein [Alphaproteobacteria bacterium]|nr:cupredoxin domain-containing protein [Alphaproteobacteria bacterium]
MNRGTIITRLALIATLLAAVPHAWAGTVEVSQKGRKFLPDSVSIKVGDMVRIRNDDEFLHHIYVTSPDFNFDSEEEPPGNSVDIKFTKAGDFNVLCRIHPKMKLAVHVSQ